MNDRYGMSFWILQTNGFWDVVLRTGTINYMWRTDTVDPLAVSSVSLVAVPCSGELIPFGQTSTGQ